MKTKPTLNFVRELKRLVKKYPSLKQEVGELGASLEADPFQGTALGKNCFKIRLAIASKGRGKSGGGRVITCVQIVDDLVYLLSIYDKSEKESLSDSELNGLLELAGLWPAE